MITIKLPYSSCLEFQECLVTLRTMQSVIIRSSYNRFREKTTLKDARTAVSKIAGIDALDSWFVESGIAEGSCIDKLNKDKKIVFGGRRNMTNRMLGKITSNEWKRKRMRKLVVFGEAMKNGNRKFELDIIENNRVIFKPKRGMKYVLELPKLKRGMRCMLFELERFSSERKCPYQVRLDENNIYLTFELPAVRAYGLNQSRFIGIDMNPNYVGVSVSEWKGDRQIILEAAQFDISKITNEINALNVKSSDQKFKSLNNKLNYETSMVAKAISKLAKKWQCKFAFIEDLNFSDSKDAFKGHAFNRLTRNHWKRNSFLRSLRKMCDSEGVKVFEVKPQYTSIIGNLKYDYVDSVNASIEIGRRGYEIIIRKTKKFYPDFDAQSLKDQWKEYFKDSAGSWKETFAILKNSGVKYRVSSDDCQRQSEVFSVNSVKSKVFLTEFIVA